MFAILFGPFNYCQLSGNVWARVVPFPLEVNVSLSMFSAITRPIKHDAQRRLNWWHHCVSSKHPMFCGSDSDSVSFALMVSHALRNFTTERKAEQYISSFKVRERY